MATKNTIAIIASTEERAQAIVNAISVNNFRLLFIEKQPSELGALQQRLLTSHPGTEVDVMNCVKDGCWEADIIILSISPAEEEKVAEQIREVATQKVVLNFSQDYQSFSRNSLQNLLKHSKVVNVLNDNGQLEINDEAISLDTGHLISCLLKINVGNHTSSRIRNVKL